MVNKFKAANAVVRALMHYTSKALALWRMWLHKRSFERAKKHADHVRRTTGRKCYVLFFKDSYKAITKQHIKHLLSIKYFKKGVSLKDLEKLSAYTTN